MYATQPCSSTVASTIARARVVLPLPVLPTISDKQVTLKLDEGNRPDTTLEGLQKLRPVFDGGVITAGNASQLSDGAAAVVVMNADVARERGLRPLGLFKGEEFRLTDIAAVV